MTKNENALEGAVLAAIWGRWRGVCVAVPLLGLLGGCASGGGTRVAFDDEHGWSVAGVDRSKSDGVQQDAGIPRASAPVSGTATASQSTLQKGGSYVVFGKRYHVDASSEGHVEKGLASWYGGKFHGRRTASGERYDMFGFTAAHKSLPLPTYAEVTNLVNGRSILVKINDRGPFVDGRVIDLSYAAAKELRIVDAGVAMVEVRAVEPTDIVVRENMFLAASQRPSRSADGGSQAAGIEAARASQGEMHLAAAEGVSGGRSEPQLASAVAKAHDGTVAGATPMLASATTGPRPAAVRSQGKLYVRAGEFGTRDSAERLRRRLVDHLAEQVEVRVSDGSLSRYAVQIGPLASPAQAKDVSEQLVALGVAESATAGVE